MATEVVPISPKQKKSFLLRVIPDSKLAQELEDATDESKTIQQLVIYHFLPKQSLVQPRQKGKEIFLIMKNTSSSHQNRVHRYPIVKIMPRGVRQKQEAVSLCFKADSKELVVLEDLNVFHSQEECVSVDPAYHTIAEKEEKDIGEMTLLAVSGSDLVGEDVQKEDWREKSPGGDALDYSLSPEQRPGCQEERRHALAPRQRKMRNLLVTVVNDAPLEELSKYVDLSIVALTSNQRTRRWHTCPLCGKQFNDSSYLISHQRTHTHEKPYQCSYCGKSFHYKTNLNKHERIHTGEKPYSCSQCGKTFRQNAHRSRHEGIHVREKTFKCPEYGQNFPDKEELVLHLQSETKRPYDCKSCARRFGRLSDSTRHERTHSAYENQSRNKVLSLPEVSGRIFNS
ncbi:LOW QUALITY PROTEIN: zinc finger protein 200 [Thomomys bottae]